MHTCVYLHHAHAGMNDRKAAQQGVAAGVADAGPMGISYENVNPLPQPSTVKTTHDHLYENIPTVSHHQDNIEMDQCSAYGVLM